MPRISFPHNHNKDAICPICAPGRIRQFFMAGGRIMSNFYRISSLSPSDPRLQEPALDEERAPAQIPKDEACGRSTVICALCACCHKNLLTCGCRWNEEDHDIPCSLHRGEK